MTARAATLYGSIFPPPSRAQAEKVAMQRRRDELTSRLVEAESRATIAEEQEASMSADLRAALAERDAMREALERVRDGLIRV